MIFNELHLHITNQCKLYHRKNADGSAPTHRAIIDVINFAIGNRVTSLAPKSFLVGISVTVFVVKFVRLNVLFVRTSNYLTLIGKQGNY